MIQSYALNELETQKFGNCKYCGCTLDVEFDGWCGDCEMPTKDEKYFDITIDDEAHFVRILRENDCPFGDIVYSAIVDGTHYEDVCNVSLYDANGNMVFGVYGRQQPWLADCIRDYVTRWEHEGDGRYNRIPKSTVKDYDVQDCLDGYFQRISDGMSEDAAIDDFGDSISDMIDNE